MREVPDALLEIEYFGESWSRKSEVGFRYVCSFINFTSSIIFFRIMSNYYTASDRMSDLIEDNYSLLQVLSRFGMSLGFGDQTVGEVCESSQVDTATFLLIINFIHSGYTQLTDDVSNLSVAALLDYLRQSHVYFLDYVLPRIHQDLHSALQENPENAINHLIHQQFDNYLSSVEKHMRYEERTLFPYVEQLLRHQVDSTFELQTFSKHHHAIDDELRELKKILIKYSPVDTNRTKLNAVLYQIYDCEKELDAHCKAEDYIFVPAVYDLKEKILHEG